MELIAIDDTYELNSILIDPSYNQDEGINKNVQEHNMKKDTPQSLADMILLLYNIALPSENIDKVDYLPKAEEWNRIQNSQSHPKGNKNQPTEGCCSIS